MTNVHLVVDLGTIETRKTGPVTGEVWLVLGPHEFPARNWNDFVVVILEACANALLRILRGVSIHERIYFMDGPYLIDIKCSSRGVLRLRAIQRGNNEMERAFADTPAGEFASNLLHCAEGVLNTCRQKGYWSSDEAKLEAMLPAIRDAL